MQNLSSRELIGHETQFDKRFHAIGEQTIINLVHIREVIYMLAGLLVLAIHAHFIMKDGVKTYVLKICDLLHVAQISPITLAQAENGSSRTEYLFPKMGERTRWGIGVNDDGFRIAHVLTVGKERKKKSSNYENTPRRFPE